MTGGAAPHMAGVCTAWQGVYAQHVLPADFQYQYAICPDSEYPVTRQVYLPCRALLAQHIAQRIEQARHLALIRYRQVKVRLPAVRIPAQQSG